MLKWHYSTVLTKDGAFTPFFLSPPWGISQLKSPHPGNLPSKAKKKMPGGGGGGLGAAGIDWCISFKTKRVRLLLSSHCGWLLLKCSAIGIGFNGAETNWGIAHILGILLMNSYDTQICNYYYNLQSIRFEYTCCQEHIEWNSSLYAAHGVLD